VHHGTGSQRHSDGHYDTVTAQAQAGRGGGRTLGSSKVSTRWMMLGWFLTVPSAMTSVRTSSASSKHCTREEGRMGGWGSLCALLKVQRHPCPGICQVINRARLPLSPILSLPRRASGWYARGLPLTSILSLRMVLQA